MEELVWPTNESLILYFIYSTLTSDRAGRMYNYVHDTSCTAKEGIFNIVKPSWWSRHLTSGFTPIEEESWQVCEYMTSVIQMTLNACPNLNAIIQMWSPWQHCHRPSYEWEWLNYRDSSKSDHKIILIFNRYWYVNILTQTVYMTKISLVDA